MQSPPNTDAAKKSDFYTSVFCDSKIEDDTEEDDECSYTFHPGTNSHKATTMTPTSTLPEDFQPPEGEPIWPAEFYGETYPYP